MYFDQQTHAWACIRMVKNDQKHKKINQANLKKKNFLQNFAANFLPFLKLFSTKNAENDYCNQRLECAAPKLWSKYTTHFIILSLVTAIFSRLSWSQKIFGLKFHAVLKVIVLLMLKTFLASTYI